MQLVDTSRTVLVASKNPAKQKAAQAAVQRAWPRASLRVQGVDSASGVPDQPVGDDETLRGAVNRVQSVHERWQRAQTRQQEQQEQQQLGDEWVRCEPGSLIVAVEGGVLAREQGQLYCFAWAAVQLAGAGKASTARSAEFLLPRQLSQLVLDGIELGAADDLVFGRTKSGRGNGTVGKLTGDAVTRADYYQHTILMALIPFMNPSLYPEYSELL